jgi:DNA processing protein
VLFVHGSLDVLAGPTVGIVGTRNATRTGCETAAALAAELARCGVSVVSGLALGIDGAAHRGLLDAAGPDRPNESPVPPGRPVGVIATGLDRAYPRRHQLLHHQVADQGVLLSESPLGGGPLRWRFPARNRIIAGLSDAVVVVESRSAGGSMLTAAEALARDVTVLAVPGHPSAAAAAGPLDLIADGAAPVRDVEDVLVAIGLGGRSETARPDPVRGSAAAPDPPSPRAAAVLDALGAAPRSLGELALATALDLDQLSDALVELERRGSVARSGAWFERTSPREAPAGRGSRR